MDWTVTHHPEYWGGKPLIYPHVPPEHPKFAQSNVVGNLVFLCGNVGQDFSADLDAGPPPDIESQTVLALDAARRGLETAGGTMDNIVKTFVVITDLADYPKIRKTETEYYEKHAPRLIERPPAATLMVVPALAMGIYDIEYEAIAVRDRDNKDWPVTYYPEFWGGKELAFPHVPKDHAKFARTQRVGDLVIVSGCQALDHDTVKVETDDFTEQARIVLDKIKVGMEETGGSLATVAKTDVFLKDPAQIPLYRAVERDYFGGRPPASTVFVMKELPRPEFLIEVEAFGVAGAASRHWPISFHGGDENAAASVRAGNLVFASGCEGEGATVEEQVISALDKLRANLEAGGGSLDKVVKSYLMLRHLKDYPAMRRTELAFNQEHAPNLVAHPPPGTFLQLDAFAHPETLFQIDAVGVV